jgi:phosphoglycerol transferase
VPWTLKFWEYGTNNQKGFRHMGSKKKKSSGRPGGSSATQATSSYRPVTEVVGSNTAAERSSSGAFFGTAYFEWLVIGVASVVSYWILTARLVGVNVSVLIDEYSYVLDSHYRELTEAYYPNHLFQLVFSVTKQCGAEFYSCARSLNAVFVIAGAIFIYLLAKYISGKKWLGAIAATAAVLGSYGTYTAYFMPEAIFNFPMIVLYWALIRFGKTDNPLAWAGFGSILGIASLAKPHAFFVVPALVIFIFLWTRATKDNYLLAALLRIGSFGLASVGTKFGVGYLIAGPKALSIFGSYGDLGTAGEVATTTLTQNAGFDVIGTGWGQTLMITMVLGAALPVAILGFLELFKKDALVAEANRLRAVVGISLLNMMAVVAVFEAWQNLNTWMHTRYYSYLIPLAVVALVEAYSRASIDSKPILKRIVVGIFLVLASVALFTAAIPYGANWIDAPDFRFHIDNLVLSSILIVISIALAVWWIWDNKKPMLVAIVVALLASTFSGTYISNFLVTSFGKDSTFDQLGRVLRNYLPQDELDKAILIGDNPTAMERVLFEALTGGAKVIRSSEDAIDVKTMGPDVSWIIQVGEASLTGLPQPLISGPTYSLYSLRTDNLLVPRKNDFGSITGSCLEPENLGWACGTETVIELGRSIPARGEIDLIIDVSEEAALGDLEFALGDSVFAGTLPKGIYSFTINFENTSPQSSITVRSQTLAPAAGQTETRLVRIVSAIVNNR